MPTSLTCIGILSSSCLTTSVVAEDESAVGGVPSLLSVAVVAGDDIEDAGEGVRSSLPDCNDDARDDLV